MSLSKFIALLILIFAFVLVGIIGSSFAAAATTGIAMQDLNGTTTADTNFGVFIYDAETGGNLVFQDWFTNVVNGRAITITLGDTNKGKNALDLNYGQTYWTDINVETSNLDFNGFDKKRFVANIGGIDWIFANTNFAPYDLNIHDLNASNNIRLWDGNYYIGRFFNVGNPQTNPQERIIFDNTYDNNALDGIVPNKIIFYSMPDFIAGIGMSSGVMNYFSGGGHSWYVDFNQTSQGIQAAAIVGTTGEFQSYDTVRAGRLRSATGTEANIRNAGLIIGANYNYGSELQYGQTGQSSGFALAQFCDRSTTNCMRWGNQADNPNYAYGDYGGGQADFNQLMSLSNSGDLNLLRNFDANSASFGNKDANIKIGQGVIGGIIFPTIRGTGTNPLTYGANFTGNLGLWDENNSGMNVVTFYDQTGSALMHLTANYVPIPSFRIDVNTSILGNLTIDENLQADGNYLNGYYIPDLNNTGTADNMGNEIATVDLNMNHYYIFDANHIDLRSLSPNFNSYYDLEPTVNSGIGALRLFARNSAGTDTQFASLTSQILQTTAGDEYGNVSLSAISGGAQQRLLNMFNANVYGMGQTIFFGIGEDGQNIYITANSPDDANAGYLTISSSDGGTSTIGDGKDSNSATYASGNGSDAYDDGGTPANGGNAFNAILSAGVGGAGIYGGANGTDGNAVVEFGDTGYYILRNRITGKILLIVTPDGNFRFRDSQTAADLSLGTSWGDKLGIWDDGLGKFFGFSARSGYIDFKSEGIIRTTWKYSGEVGYNTPFPTAAHDFTGNAVFRNDVNFVFSNSFTNIDYNGIYIERDINGGFGTYTGQMNDLGSQFVLRNLGSGNAAATLSFANDQSNVLTNSEFSISLQGSNNLFDQNAAIFNNRLLNGEIKFMTEDTEQMRITNTGNVRIVQDLNIAKGIAYPNAAVCYLATGNLGHCTTTVANDGTCTCVAN